LSICYENNACGQAGGFMLPYHYRIMVNLIHPLRRGCILICAARFLTIRAIRHILLLLKGCNLNSMESIYIEGIVVVT